MIQRCPDFQTDWVDDGVQVLKDKYVKDYIEIIEMIYAEWTITINRGKSQIIINTDTPHRKQWLAATFPHYKNNNQGQLIYLGVPHGSQQFVDQYMQQHLNKLYKKILYIERIQHLQIRTTMYRKFFNYNKILYLLKHCKYTKIWMPHITTMYDTITASITAHMIDKHKPTIHWQLSLSQRAGGYGMRQPEYYYLASKISAMTMSEERIETMFNSECKDNTAPGSDLSRKSTNITRTSAYQLAKQSNLMDYNNK